VIETEALKQEGERFLLEGRPIPRLTEVLQGLGIVDYNAIPKNVREFALHRGSMVHRATELWDLGTLREETLDPVLAPYLDGWRKAVHDLNLAWENIEVRRINRIYWFVCKPDRDGTMDGEPVVCEIKTGAVAPFTALQTAGQAACIQGGEKYKRIAIGLPGDGTYKLHRFTDRNDRALILGAISLFNWKAKQ
jgi:hypothetical protein